MACALLLAASVAPAADLFPARDRGSVFFIPQVRFTNLTVTVRDSKTATIRFDVGWDSSWRQPVNHDAAWIFFKVRAGDPSTGLGAGKGEWQHVRLAADRVLNPSGYGQAETQPLPPRREGSLPFHLLGAANFGRPGGLERSRDFFARTSSDTRLEFLVPDGADGFTGLFLRRATNGFGTVQARGVTAIWDLTTAKGITDPAKVQIRGFGVEMVYVPEGPYAVGTGGNEINAFYAYTENQERCPPYRVTSAGAIPTGQKPGKLWARGAQPEDGGEIPAAFPNGYRAFYCMKQHITPSRYAEFLEMLTPAQSDARYPPDTVKIGWNVVRSGTSPNYTYTWSPGGPRAGAGMPRLSWADGAAYAAWCGLRPMTELEIEKVVRGPREPMPAECGPSYWGISAFSLWEWESIKGWETQSDRAVTVGNARGRAFTGTHGDGTVVLPADWPQDDAVGSGIRCEPNAGLNRAQTSDRFSAATTDTARAHKFRAVRTAPVIYSP